MITINCMNNPEFVILTGPMFSSKTTKLLTALERYRHQKKTVVVVKPSIDDRYALGEIVSHSGWRTPARTVRTGQDVLDMIAECDEIVDAVAVDEAFMIPGIADALVWLFRQGVSIVVSTLDLSATGKAFKETRDMMPWATRVEKCAAVCTVCGCDAHYTHRRIANDEEIQVGGEELYEPRCFSHHVIIDDRSR